MFLTYLILLGAGKKFWSYIRNEQCGIPSLEHSNQLYKDSTAKANNLNDHFSSIFTIDNSHSHEIPTVEGSPYPNMQSISINAQGIALLL